MSSNRELEFIETADGKWFYVLEDVFAPKESWDWHEFAKAHGPFKSEEAANEHQYDFSRISTSGATITPKEHLHMTPVLERLLSEATLERAW